MAPATLSSEMRVSKDKQKKLKRFVYCDYMKG